VAAVRFGTVWAAVVAIASFACWASLPAFAGHTSQTLAVSARVSPSASVGFEISAQPLEITSSDLDRGYVDVVMKSRMHVKTSRGGEPRPSIVMDVEPRNDLFKAMNVATTGNGNGHSTMDAPALPTDGAQASAGQVREFRYRFEFSKSAREGQYATAISVAIDL
jgi:hypothetical protein